MTLIVSPLSHVPAVVKRRRPSHVITLLDPVELIDPLEGYHPERHLRLGVHDIPWETEGMICPDQGTVETILAFGATWDGAAPLLVHCWAASAARRDRLHPGLRAQPEVDERRIAGAMRAASRTPSRTGRSWPSPRDLLAAAAAWSTPPRHRRGDSPMRASRSTCRSATHDGCHRMSLVIGRPRWSSPSARARLRCSPYATPTACRAAFGPSSRRAPHLRAGHARFVAEQTGFQIGYVEQLYTSATRAGRPAGDVGAGTARVSRSATWRSPGREADRAPEAAWSPWTRFFPWETGALAARR